MTTNNIVIEYVWLDGEYNLRSKTRVIKVSKYDDISLETFPEWNYDGSSTYQATTDNSEIILKPIDYYITIDLFANLGCHYIVLCSTYDTKGEPIKTNSYYFAEEIFNKYADLEPWFGLEQEYYFLKKSQYYMKDDLRNIEEYCRPNRNSVEREMVIKHLEMCLELGLNISGVNAEVTESQWEFQIGPCLGISACNELTIARFLLERIAEQYDYKISYHPKLFGNISGSGCHINFSTKVTREEGGIEHILKYINYLKNNHLQTLETYGAENKNRLSGKFETASWSEFNWGIGTRNTSIRVPYQTAKEQKGYFEDRRPGANIDPYKACSTLLLHSLS